MTSSVIIRAHQGGWPVEFTQVKPGAPLLTVSATQRVEPGEERQFAVHSGADLLIHEVPRAEDPVAGGSDWRNEEVILQFFAYEHLPQSLQVVSRPFHDLARYAIALLPRNAERTVALRKLLEAKDAAVRAAICKTVSV